MGVEVAGSDTDRVNGEVVEQNKSKLKQMENGKSDLEVTEPIKFGSHGADVLGKEESIKIPVSDVPKDAADEWPEQKLIHSFYFPKVRPYEDPKLKAKINDAEKEIQKLIFKRNQIFESLKEKRSLRSGVIEQLKPLSSDRQQLDIVINEKRTVMRPLQEALGSLRGPNSLCSSEEELNDLIHSLNYQIQHESIPLSEEKKLIREIKQLEGTREKVIANAAARAKIQEEAVQDKFKAMGSDLGEAKEKRQTVRAQISRLEGELKVINDDIKALENELDINSKKKEEAFAAIKELRQQRDSMNKMFYENRTVLNQARELAAKKDIKALEEFLNEEVGKFMSQWSSTKAFRSDYERRTLGSLDSRQLSRDGRIRNFDEKPIVSVEPSRQTEAEKVSKSNHRAIKEEPKSVVAKKENEPTQKVEKESKKKPAESKPGLKEEEEEDIFVVEKKPKEEKKIDLSKLKDMKREEEMAKQKQALERKKKLAEKAAAKAAIRAQKEAEKKQKKREKKSKKEVGAELNNTEEATEKEAENPEGENPEAEEENAEALDASTKAKVQQKERSDAATIRSRATTRGIKVGSRSSVQKVILKRKKSNKYWMWAAPAGVAVVMLLALIAYYYLF